jgi:hypothetical protein
MWRLLWETRSVLVHFIVIREHAVLSDYEIFYQYALFMEIEGVSFLCILYICGKLLVYHIISLLTESQKDRTPPQKELGHDYH